jgi:hypothetical protein
MCRKKCHSPCILLNKILHKKDWTNKHKQCVERNVSPLEEHLLLKDASSSTKFYTKKVAQKSINHQCVERSVSLLEEHLPLKDASSSTKFYTKKVAQISINNQCVERSVSPLKEHLPLKDASSLTFYSLQHTIKPLIGRIV